MERKAVPFELKAVDPEGRTFEGYASVFRSPDKDSPDMTGDMVCAGAFKKSIAERGHKVRMLWQHDPSQPIGRWTSMREDDQGLYVKGQISETSLGRDVMTLLKDGAVDSMSIGYEPIPADTEYAKTAKGDSVRLLRAVKLWEVSLVSFPADQAAKVTAVKAALPPHDTAKADEGASWDAGAVLKACEGQEMLRRVHAWMDPDGDPEAKASYKLPHHLPGGEVVWRGVAAAAARMNQLDIPESDMAGVRAHLAAHYRQFDRTPPWEGEGKEVALLDLAEAFGGAIDSLLASPQPEAKVKLPMLASLWAAHTLVEAKAGRRLSARSKNSIRAAIEALTALLGEDEEQAARETEEQAKAAPEPVVPAAPEIESSDSPPQDEPGADPPTAEIKAAGPVTTPPTSEHETHSSEADDPFAEFDERLARITAALATG